MPLLEITYEELKYFQGDIEEDELIAAYYQHEGTNIPCRAKVLKRVSPTEFKVMFVDYGNIEVVDLLQCIKVESFHFDAKVQVI